MPRLFAGIALPEAVRETLMDLQQPLPSTHWIDDADLHITLRFAGDLAPPEAREFAANLNAIRFDPFSLHLEGLATFGGEDPRLLYAAIGASEPLLDLARATETAARRAGLKPEGRKFTPHVTIARFQTPRIDPIACYLSRYGGMRSKPFVVTEFALYSAKPNTGGGPYIVEQTFPSTLGAFEEDMEWFEEDESASPTP